MKSIRKNFVGLVGLVFCTAVFSTVSANDDPVSEGRVLFEAYCAVCHGADGKGDGPSATQLSIRPADLTEIAERRDGIWPILEVMSIIDGYTKKITPREDMPIIEEITEGPMIEFDTGNGITTTIPARLLALAEYLESIQYPEPTGFVP